MPEGLQRRDVLRTTGLVLFSGGAVLTLAACGAEGQAGDPVPTSAAPSTAASSAPPSASGTPSASSAGSSASKASGTTPSSGPSVATADVPVGGGVILSDADFVVTQPTQGQFKAFSKICTHKGCTVAKVADGTIQCPCHGSQFSIQDGSVAHPPATEPLRESTTAVAGSKVFVTG